MLNITDTSVVCFVRMRMICSLTYIVACKNECIPSRMSVFPSRLSRLRRKRRSNEYCITVANAFGITMFNVAFVLSIKAASHRVCDSFALLD
jgi:hypothetical protein